MPRTASGGSVLRLRIQLNEVDPVVWRRLLVPGSVRLSKLTEMLLAAMGWTNSHLHAFRVGDRLYGMHAEDYPDDEIDEKTVTLLEALHGESRFAFEYDFGDGWEHEVAVEESYSSLVRLKYAVCLDGANACPPEDVGGVSGYELFCRPSAIRVMTNTRTTSIGSANPSTRPCSTRHRRTHCFNGCAERARQPWGAEEQSQSGLRPLKSQRCNPLQITFS